MAENKGYLNLLNNPPWVFVILVWHTGCGGLTLCQTSGIRTPTRNEFADYVVCRLTLADYNPIILT